MKNVIDQKREFVTALQDDFPMYALPSETHSKASDVSESSGTALSSAMVTQLVAIVAKIERIISKMAKSLEVLSSLPDVFSSSSSAKSSVSRQLSHRAINRLQQS